MKQSVPQQQSRRRFLKYTACAALTASGVTRAATGWSQAPSLPLRIQEIYPCLHQGALWVAGGLSADAATGAIQISDQVMRLPIGEQRWLDAPSLPVPRHHGFLVSNNGVLYLIGGFVAAEGGQWHAKRDVLRLENDDWMPLGELPSAQSETVTAVFNGRIHLAGGRAPIGARNANWNDQADIATHHVFDPNSAESQIASPLPMARNSAASFVIDDQWHVVGGRTVNGGNTDRHDIYDFAEERWRQGAPLPQAQGGLAAASIGQQGFVFGGEYFSAAGGGVYPEVWGYDARTEKWRQAGVMPVPRHGLGAVAVDGLIYVIAGAIGAGGNGTSDRLSVFQP